jgi:hypothetical protein
MNSLYKKYIYLSCEKATFLGSKKTETGLSRSELIRLRYHLFCCASCKHFAEQIVLLDEKINHLIKSDEFKLSADKKAAIQKKLSEF